MDNKTLSPVFGNGVFILDFQLLPEFCKQLSLIKVRYQVAAIELGDECYSKIQAFTHQLRKGGE